VNFILRETQPLTLTVNGVEYPAIWNFKAIAIMEDYSGLMHLYSIARLKAGNPELKDLIGAIYGMLSAAGVTCVGATGKDVLIDAIIQSVSPADELSILDQVKKIIAIQGDQPKEDNSKNASRPQKKI